MSQTPYEKRQAEQLASIEEIATEVRIFDSIERKARDGTELSLTEISYLFEFETPAHKRQESRVQWDYDDIDTETLNRWERKRTLQEELRAQSARVLQERYGTDADWLLLPYAELVELLPGLIAQKSADELTALFPYIADDDLFKLFGTYVEKLTAEGRAYVAKRLSHELTSTETGKAFVRRFAAELYSSKSLSDWDIIDAFSFGASILEDIAALRSAGILRINIVRNFSREAVETHFDDLVAAGFSVESLVERCSKEFKEKNLDKIYALAPTIIETFSEKGDDSEQYLDRIIDIQRRGGSITTQLDKLIRIQPFHNQEMFDRLVTEAKVSPDTIFDALAALDSDRSYILWYLQWFSENNISHQKILSVLHASTIVDQRERLRSAGIAVEVSQYIDAVNPVWILWNWEQVKSEDIGMTIDEAVERVEGQMDSVQIDEVIQRALLYGANVSGLLAKVADGTIVAESTYERIIDAGASREQVWPKLHRAVKRSIALGVIATGAEKLTSESGMVLASLEEGDFRENLEKLCATEEGANTVFPLLPEHEIQQHYRLLIESGVPIEKVVPYLQQWEVTKDLSWFLEKGATPEYLFESIRGPHFYSAEIEMLVGAGLPVDGLVKEISSQQAQGSFDFLLERVADKKAFVNLCMQNATRWFLSENYVKLLDNGAGVNRVGLEIEANVFIDNLKEFMIRGADSFTVMAQFSRQYPGRSHEWYIAEIRRRTGV